MMVFDELDDAGVDGRPEFRRGLVGHALQAIAVAEEELGFAEMTEFLPGNRVPARLNVPRLDQPEIQQDDRAGPVVQVDRRAVAGNVGTAILAGARPRQVEP